MLKLLIYLLLAQVGLILAARKFLLWYLKINPMLATLRSIDESLKWLPGVRHAIESGWRDPLCTDCC